MLGGEPPPRLLPSVAGDAMHYPNLLMQYANVVHSLSLRARSSSPTPLTALKASIKAAPQLTSLSLNGQKLVNAVTVKEIGASLPQLKFLDLCAGGNDGFGGDKGSKFHVKLVPESANDFEIHHEQCHGHAEVSGSLCKSCSDRRFRKAMRKRIRTAVASRVKAPGAQAPRFTWANSPTKVWVHSYNYD